VIKENSSFSKTVVSLLGDGGGRGEGAGGAGGAGGGGGRAKKGDGHHGKFVWRIENFTRLKDLLKKRKITGLCIKSRRFQVGRPRLPPHRVPSRCPLQHPPASALSVGPSPLLLLTPLLPHPFSLNSLTPSLPYSLTPLLLLLGMC